MVIDIPSVEKINLLNLFKKKLLEIIYLPLL